MTDPPARWWHGAGVAFGFTVDRGDPTIWHAWAAVRAGHYVDQVTLWLILMHLYGQVKGKPCEFGFDSSEEFGEIIIEIVVPGKGLRRIG